MLHIAKENVRHNGKNYSAGDEIPGLSQEQADRLFQLNVIEEVEGDEEADNNSLLPLSVKDMNITELKKHLADVIDPAEVEQLLADEQASDARKGAIEALSDRLQELTGPME